MLSAAEDIMDQQQHKHSNNDNTMCEVTLTSRHCESKSTGAVLVADNLPTLICKLTLPFFMHRIPFGFRHAVVCLLQLSSYIMVAFSTSVDMALSGVSLGAFAAGIGEITYLGLSSFFPPSMIAAWASGTGGAGLIGSLSYAFLTEPDMGGLSPKAALLAQTFIPVVFALAYWLLLDPPEDVYKPTLNPTSWIVPEEPLRQTSSDVLTTRPLQSVRVQQRKLNFITRIQLIVPLLHLMIPVAIVYLTESLINQGVTQLIVFNCHRGFDLSMHSKYRWYQSANLIFFIFEAMYWFVPSIDGFSYVNNFSRIHKQVSPDVREYSLSIATLGNTIGINVAEFIAIPLHNWVCAMKMPSKHL